MFKIEGHNKENEQLRYYLGLIAKLIVYFWKNEVQQDVLTLMICIRIYNNLKISQEQYMKGKLPTHVRITVGELFGKYDINQNGQLERNQIKLALHDIYARLGVKNEVSQGDVDNFINDYDSNKDGKLSWSDFVNMYALNFYNTYEREHLPSEISIPIDEIFKRYDHDNNGTLDFKELEECLQSIFDRLGVHSKANLNDVRQFFKDYDANGDGKISREDFKKVYAIQFHSF